MRAESFGAAAASVALGAVLVVSTLHAGRLLLEPLEHVEKPVVAAGPAFDTVDVAHLLEQPNHSADARREPRPSTATTPEATADAPGSGTSRAGGPALAEAGTAAEDDPAVESGPPRPVPQPSPQPAPPQQPADSERRLAEPAAPPAPRIRALSGERRTPEHADESPVAHGSVPADVHGSVEQGAEAADERVRSASLAASTRGPHACEPTTEDDGADPQQATARDLEEAEVEEPEAGEPDPPTAEPAVPATPAGPKPRAADPDRPPQDPPPVEPATPATPPRSPADPGPADEATDTDS